MAKCLCLEGENIKPSTAAEAKKLMGKLVRYLRSNDVDRRRGYFFPRCGEVVGVNGRNVMIDGDWVYLPDLYEMVEVKSAANTEEASNG
ncbi:hypothetical protein TSH7_01135 [Azospirillum sp. TSH7]|uniref:hypothetical protein n=1 Tax=unclassified Azospirillum TaxID=2630922 RepID=UPI000D61EA6B|nr:MULTISPECIES: hypothetical protein [unclassified Azospirillum]PWC69080.1 hypothetical protein TSH7_01135 [Azospirillum sp. TSH7]PWC71428.1 hypothetical protein TSH20_03940 [Azospirillum sp. TSH20]